MTASIALDLVCMAVGYRRVCHGWGLFPADTLQAAALAWPLWCPLSLRHSSARCLVFTVAHVWLLEVVAAAGIEADSWHDCGLLPSRWTWSACHWIQKAGCAWVCFLQIHCRLALLLGHPCPSSVTQAGLSALPGVHLGAGLVAWGLWLLLALRVGI